MNQLQQTFIFYLDSALFLPSIFILGLLVGSFLNVVIFRLPLIMQNQWRVECEVFLHDLASNNSLPNQEHAEPKSPENVSLPKANKPTLSLSYPPSRCGHCSYAIAPWQNIPVISYILLRGKCHHCKDPISIRYPLIELLTAVLSLSVALKFGASLQTLFLLLLSWALITLAFIDADTQLLPDNITLPLLWCGLLINSFGVFTSLQHALFGAVLGYISLWLVFWLFKLVTNKEGLGFGDLKLTAALLAWLGWSYFPMILLMASVTAIVVALIGILIKRSTQTQQMAFGPYLASAGWLSIMYGSEIAIRVPFIFPFFISN